MANIQVFESRRKAILEAFEEAMTNRELNYLLSTLTRYGFEDDIEINTAIKKSMAICNGLGIDPKRHFRYFYRVDMLDKVAVKEWKATKLGFYLVLCNGVSDNPFTAALQIEMLKGFISNLD